MHGHCAASTGSAPLGLGKGFGKGVGNFFEPHDTTGGVFGGSIGIEGGLF
jgi:hypothetical protein